MFPFSRNSSRKCAGVRRKYVTRPCQKFSSVNNKSLVKNSLSWNIEMWGVTTWGYLDDMVDILKTGRVERILHPNHVTNYRNSAVIQWSFLFSVVLLLFLVSYVFLFCLVLIFLFSVVSLFTDACRWQNSQNFVIGSSLTECSAHEAVIEEFFEGREVRLEHFLELGGVSGPSVTSIPLLESWV